MKQNISQEMIDTAHRTCIKLLDQYLSRDKSAPLGARHLDVSMLIDKIAWDILVPFFLGVASEFTVETLKTFLLERKGSADSKENVLNLIGREVEESGPENHDEWIMLVHDSAKQIGLNRKQTEMLIGRLLIEIKNISKDT